jgi:hypothetical protein
MNITGSTYKPSLREVRWLDGESLMYTAAIFLLKHRACESDHANRFD